MTQLTHGCMLWWGTAQVEDARKAAEAEAQAKLEAEEAAAAAAAAARAARRQHAEAEVGGGDDFPCEGTSGSGRELLLWVVWSLSTFVFACAACHPSKRLPKVAAMLSPAASLDARPMFRFIPPSRTRQPARSL